MLMCKLEGCPYNDKNGFCSNRLVVIDENGHCSQIWKRGIQKRDAFQFIADEYKQHVTIIDAEEDVSTVDNESSQSGTSAQ